MSDEKQEEKILWGDIDEAPRDVLISSFEFARERLFAQLIELDTSIDYVNRTRFADDPIEIDFDFRTQLAMIHALPRTEQTPIRNHAAASIQRWQDQGVL